MLVAWQIYAIVYLHNSDHFSVCLYGSFRWVPAAKKKKKKKEKRKKRKRSYFGVRLLTIVIIALKIRPPFKIKLANKYNKVSNATEFAH